MRPSKRLYRPLVLALIITCVSCFHPTRASSEVPEPIAKFLRHELADLPRLAHDPEMDIGEQNGFGYECAGEIFEGPFRIRKTGRGFYSDGTCLVSAFVVTKDAELIAAFEGRDTFSHFRSVELDPKNDTRELFVFFDSMAIREPHDAMIVAKLPNDQWDTITLDRVSHDSNNGITSVMLEPPNVIVGRDDNPIFFEGVGLASYHAAFRPIRLYQLRAGRLVDVSAEPAYKKRIQLHLARSIDMAISGEPLGPVRADYNSVGFWASYAATEALLGRLDLVWTKVISRVGFNNLQGNEDPHLTNEERLARVLRANGYAHSDWSPPVNPQQSIAKQPQPRTVSLEDLPPAVRQHIYSVRESCRRFYPDFAPHRPMQGVTIVDLDGDGSRDVLVDNEWLCNDHIPAANCTNRGCDLLIWKQYEPSSWKLVFKEHLHRKFVSIDRETGSFRMMATSIYAGDKRCNPAPQRDYMSSQTCDLLVTFEKGRWRWRLVE